MSSNISNVRLPYVYLIRHIPTGKFYAGSRTSKKCHPSDFWVSYHTSSKIVKQIISEEGKDSFEILEIIPRPNDDALEYEVSLLNSVNARAQTNWLNKTNGHTKYKCIFHTEESKLKIGLASKQRTMSIIARTKMSISKRNPSDETRKKLSESAKKSMTPEAKLRLKTARSLSNRSNESRLKSSIKLQSRPMIKCPHCDKESNALSMNRWHFDNCKSLIT